MSGEFDSQCGVVADPAQWSIRTALYGEEKDARCRTAIVGSDDVVQTAPVKCRYTKSGICANIAGFCLCRQANFALPMSSDGKSLARTHLLARGSTRGVSRRIAAIAR